METEKFIKNNKWKIVIIVLIALISFTIASGYTYIRIRSRRNLPTISNITNLQTFSATDLQQYDGTDPNKPIYIGLNGYVYDVSPGRSYYETGGTYHYLAGRDSSSELNLVGGDIIVKKYTVIGVLK